MSSALRSRQRWLPLSGPAEHFDLLHGGHGANVAVCTKSRGDVWAERVYPHDDARAVAVGLASSDDLNLYQSQAGYRADRRVIANVAALPAAFVDLDFYRVPDLAGLDAESVLDRVLDALPWLPLPTLLFNSGRGAYLEWLFDKPLSPDQLGAWQAVQRVLVEALAPFGADRNAADAARVLRVVGSVNLRNSERVAGLRDIGPAVRFDQFKGLVLSHGLAEARNRAVGRARASGDCGTLPRELRRAVDDSGGPTAAQRAQAIKPYDLAHARMLDCRTIAELRGVPMTDYRHRLLFVYAVSAAWFVGGEDQLVAELEAFAADHFADPDRYGPRCAGTVIDRLRRDREGVVAVWFDAGVRVPNRYRLRNDTIIRYLDLTAAEQRELRTIMGPEERQRRRVDRRRAAGVADRAARTADRQARAVELRRAGLSQAAIAAELGVQQPAVSKMLRRAGVGHS